jgi:hypothetical protein
LEGTWKRKENKMNKMDKIAGASSNKRKREIKFAIDQSQDKKQIQIGQLEVKQEQTFIALAKVDWPKSEPETRISI